MTEEPHRTRRTAIMKAQPEVHLATYVLCPIGGTANHNLFLAIHEITLNLAFRAVSPNKLLAIFANLPTGIPYSAAFKVGPALCLAQRSNNAI